jgi:predicted hotdog family 3-hydroxylacyl-ACP dehydratase
LIHGPAPEVELLIPHREPMLLLRSVRVWDQRSIRCTGSIPLRSELARRTGAPVFLGIEMGAQAAAAHESLRSSESGDRSPAAPTRGYLVSIRTARFPERSIPLGTELRVEASLVGSAGPLAMYQVAVSSEDGGRLLLEAQISTIRFPDDSRS